MRRAFVLICLAFGAQAAQAQVDFRSDPDARADLALIETCMADAQSREAAQTCVSVTYKLCISRLDGNVSHTAERGCFLRELELWNHLYDVEVALTEAWTITWEANVRSTGNNRVPAHDIFLKAEAAWRDHMAAQCALEMERWGSGTARITSEPQCHMRFVAARLLFFRQSPALRGELSEP